MFYLVVKNLGKERCIHKSEDDIYVEDMSFSCTRDLAYTPKELLREIRILCSELPHPPMMARVYRD